MFNAACAKLYAAALTGDPKAVEAIRTNVDARDKYGVAEHAYKLIMLSMLEPDDSAIKKVGMAERLQLMTWGWEQAVREAPSLRHLRQRIVACVLADKSSPPDNSDSL